MGEKTFFVSAFSGGRVCRICLKGHIYVQKGHFSCQKDAFTGGRGTVSTSEVPSWAKKAPLLAGRRPYNVFVAEIDPRPRYSANGDESWLPCTGGAGAHDSNGEGAQPMQLPLDPPLF